MAAATITNLRAALREKPTLDTLASELERVEEVLSGVAERLTYIRRVLPHVRQTEEVGLSPSGNPPAYLTVRQAAEYLSLSSDAVYDRINRHGLPVVRLGGTVLRIRRDSLDAWVARQQHEGSGR